MANIKSAIKMNRVAAGRAARNKPARSAAKTRIDKAESLIASKGAAAQPAVAEALSALDQAAQQGVIHKNNAARRKSRLMKKLNAAPAK